MRTKIKNIHLRIEHPIKSDGVDVLLNLGKIGWKISGAKENKKESVIYLKKK